MFREHVTIPYEAIADLCQRYHIRKLSLFGSVLREDFRDDSDIDVLVEFDPDARIGLKFIDIRDELTELLGREVDLNMPNSLSDFFCDEVLGLAEVIYERA
jgi:uncharacterized protein